MFDNAPLPGLTYPIGTMSASDIYPTHQGIGGVTTQDRALPAFSDAVSRNAIRAQSLGSFESLAGHPAGWLAVLLLGIAVAAWLHR